jgi:beta-lactam-binding protein with PASTA domain
MSITLDHADASGATVTISSQRVTVPEVRGLSASQAAEAMTATGFRVLTAPVPDPTCAYIGVVAQTSPSAGARVFPGTQVTLGIGERDPTRECQ